MHSRNYLGPSDRVQKKSFNSCNNLSTMFKMMFPDSHIAKYFTLGPDKASYLIVHGLAPFFQEQLLDRLKTCEFLVICFDEALNKVIQKGQMDIIAKFWDNEKQKIVTRYVTSVFLTKSSAEQLLKHFLQGISPLPLSKLLQISMDGPNVNLNFLSRLQDHIRSVTENPRRSLVNLGTCGLHVIHGAMKTGMESVEWDMCQVLRHLHYLFSDSPARRGNFTEITGCTNFPLKFCGVRWLENAKCLKRALEIWDHVIKFLQQAKLPKTRPVESLKKAARDPFMKCKLAFCKMVAIECQPFLQKFQTSRPMAPYLFDAVGKLLRDLMIRCVKPELLKCTDTVLLSVDVAKPENVIVSRNVDIGFAARRFLGQIGTEVSEQQKLAFLHDCRCILTSMIAKLQQRSPLKYKAVKGLSSLDPHVIQHSPLLGKKRFSLLLNELHTSDIIDDVLAENSKKEYISFSSLDTEKLQEVFQSCDEVGLDCAYGRFLAGSEEYKHLWKVVKIGLSFSHGNATVEGGFSVNKSLLVENMHDKTVTAQRHIHDEVREAGGIEHVQITRRMMVYVKGARRRYQEYLQQQKEERSDHDKKEAEKRKLEAQLEDLERKKICVKKDSDEKQLAIDLELNEMKKRRASLC